MTPPVPAWMADEAATVREVAAYWTTDDLTAQTARAAADHPGVVSLRTIGRSASGEPIGCITVDGGPTARGDAVVIGLPHPNEPVGGLTSVHLVRRLAENAALRRRLGLTWHVVPNVDPDGLRLNEGWLRGPFTREHYTRHFYRQAFVEQIDWNFPIGDPGQRTNGSAPDQHDPVPPETRALISLIDDHPPTLLVSLHNSEVGNVYYYLGRDERELYSTLQQIPQMFGLSLYRGVPEAGWVRPLADGIHRALDIRDSIAHRVAHGGAPRSSADRNSSVAYAARYGALSLMTEVPYWRDPRTSDGTETDTPLAEALTESAAQMTELGATLTDSLAAVDGHATVGSPFLRASRHFALAATETGKDALQQAMAPRSARPATVAEVASLTESVHMFRLRNSGMLLRALDAELGSGNAHPTVRAARADLMALHGRWCAEAVDDATRAGVVLNPIRALVATQYASILAAADHLGRET